MMHFLCVSNDEYLFAPIDETNPLKLTRSNDESYLWLSGRRSHIEACMGLVRPVTDPVYWDSRVCVTCNLTKAQRVGYVLRIIVNELIGLLFV